MSGMGVYDSIDGSKYFGGFKGNKPNGNGLFRHLEGKSMREILKMGLFMVKAL